jgi:flavin reductase (DIM6/NTAB) family NADH-FMN oxidoreductase RutF
MSEDRLGPARAAFGPIAMPVTIVASAAEGRGSWATATVMYVSFRPPQICVALSPGSRTLAMARASGELSVSLLAASQQSLAIRAGRRTPGDVVGIPDAYALPPPDGFHSRGVAGAMETLWCRVENEVPTADHVLVIATVVVQQGGLEDGSDRPLLRLHRRYHALGEALSEPSPEGYPI